MKQFMKYILKTAGGLIVTSVLGDIIDETIKNIKRRTNTETNKGG